MDEANSMELTAEDLQNVMEQNRHDLNAQLPVYSKLQAFEIQEEEFQKTPKKSIKRYLYK
jgi:long-chain acyl-CoA synthetase